MPELTPNPALQPLAALVGEWEMESPQFPGARGRVTFAWLEGGAFLVQHSRIDHGSAPNATMVVGRDESTETYGALYFDSRGVSRVYQMRLSEGIWTMWRDAPGFSQRFTGTFSDDGTTIAAHWEKSSDGAQWEHDFDLTYTKVTGQDPRED